MPRGRIFSIPREFKPKVVFFIRQAKAVAAAITTGFFAEVGWQVEVVWEAKAADQY